MKPIAGLNPIQRNLMALRQVGVEAVGLLASPHQLEHLRGGAGDPADRRLPAMTFLEAGDLGQLGVEPLLWLDGERIIQPTLMAEVLARAEPGAYHLDGGGDAGLTHKTAAQHQSGETPKRRTLRGEGYVLEVGTAALDRQARRAIYRSLIKPTDGWYSVHLNRPVSLSMSKLLVPLPVHPNYVTLVTLCVGVGAMLASSLGTYWGFALGGVLFQLASIMDGVDGEIARVKYLGSNTGQWMDTICDDLTNVLYMAGVTWGVHRAWGPHWMVWIGVAAVALNLLTVGLLYWQLIFRFKSGTLLGFEWDLKGEDDSKKTWFQRCAARVEPFLKRDAYALYFMIFAFLGFAWLALPLSLIGLVATLSALVQQLNSWSRQPPEQG